ncbi:nascent polypeptide-associated complex protein [Saccharolobus solfataricus]|uniref:Nascent polypeptide-associated complex protein n=2 Tax=Saccharolobus solfataricus TaxID=2287 RepID=A0A0E3GTE7_SACSO|nr:nascent polypeptide-associated complex protein [Saccharolobus solfataricus]AKA73691.1 nascent polypeptide-associated complex protein [Saccharolobus solfataricus]AKA76388.1 nascent polypeptide-associated complex protein [Saccharolobus solfataricus]AKA79080.1 nascent polypeptide-associated complex protein [Saccharolobus solfataricus]AZF68162.1 nascent polypeptide-associated complex protein [Saccharolobus solfataricus]AZF70782.1 nascent polypeptide-associated complex protein [Saccharolobus sol
MAKIKPSDLKKMERMGIKTEQINATRVIIETNEKNIVIENPTVMKTNVMGNEAIVIYGGQTREEKKQSQIEIKDEDVKFVAEQTGKSEKDAREALVKANGDIAKAIMILQGETSNP